MSIPAVSTTTYDTLEAGYFNSLSDEVLLNIFLISIESSCFHEGLSTYYQARCACRRFKRIFSDSKIIAALLEKGHSLPLNLIRCLPRDGFAYVPILKRTYEHMVNWHLSKTGQAATVIPFLESLMEEERAQISYISLTSLEDPIASKLNHKEWVQSLAAFFGLLPNVRTIRFPSKLFPSLFSVLPGISGKITGIELQFLHAERDLENVISYFPKLQSLYIANTDKIGNESLLSTLSKRPEITELTLLDTPNIRFEELEIPEPVSLKKITLRGKNFTNQTTRFLIQRFPALESLCLGDTLNDEQAIRDILQSTLSLKELDLAHLPVMDGNFLGISPSLSKHLRILKLYGCPYITRKGIENVKGAFPKLEHLDMRL